MKESEEQTVSVRYAIPETEGNSMWVNTVPKDLYRQRLKLLREEERLENQTFVWCAVSVISAVAAVVWYLFTTKVDGFVAAFNDLASYVVLVIVVYAFCFFLIYAGWKTCQEITEGRKALRMNLSTLDDFLSEHSREKTEEIRKQQDSSHKRTEWKVARGILLVLVCLLLAMSPSLFENQYHRHQQQKEAQEIAYAEDMYALGLEQFNNKQYKEAVISLRKACSKRIGRSAFYLALSEGMADIEEGLLYSAGDSFDDACEEAITREEKQLAEQYRKYAWSLKRKEYPNSTPARYLSYEETKRREALPKVGEHLPDDIEKKFLEFWEESDGSYIFLYRATLNGTDWVLYLDDEHFIQDYKEYTKYIPRNKRSTGKKKKSSSSDPYGASDYAHPDDFYYDYEDDFWDYEDAEDYWEEYG